MKFEDENFKEEFMKWLSSKTEEEIVQKFKELEEDKKMSADEMFEELGYEKYDNHPEEEKPEVNKWTTQDCRVIEYKQSETIRGELYTLYIRFHIVGERIEIGANKRPQEIRTMSLKVNPILNIKELQAINKKVEELGWMD